MESEEYSSEYESYYSDFEPTDEPEEPYDETAVFPKLFQKFAECLQGADQLNFAESQVFRYEAVGRFLTRI